MTVLKRPPKPQPKRGPRLDQRERDLVAWYFAQQRRRKR